MVRINQHHGTHFRPTSQTKKYVSPLVSFVDKALHGLDQGSRLSCTHLGLPRILETTIEWPLIDRIVLGQRVSSRYMTPGHPEPTPTLQVLTGTPIHQQIQSVHHIRSFCDAKAPDPIVKKVHQCNRINKSHTGRWCQKDAPAAMACSDEGACHFRMFANNRVAVCCDWEMACLSRSYRLQEKTVCKSAGSIRDVRMVHMGGRIMILYIGSPCHRGCRIVTRPSKFGPSIQSMGSMSCDG